MEPIARILVVDDEPWNTQILERVLGKNHETVAVRGGTEALEALERETFDVVLLDIMMPSVSGLDVLDTIRQTPELEDLPVILVSALSDGDHIVEGLKRGANDYISKPFDIAVVMARVRTQLRLKQLMDERKHMIASLQSANELKERFMRIASHDIKNPLNNLNMVHHMLRQSTQDDDEKQTLLDNADESIQAMLEVIDRFLDTSILKNDEVELTIEPLDLARLVEQVVAQYSVAAYNKGTTLEIEHVDGAVMADASRTAQVLGNLISNAIKYSPPNSVVRISTEHCDDGIQINVIDEGPGIPEDEYDRLFQPFSKLSPRPTAGEGSTGLGLWIVRQLTELQDGEVGVDCPPSGGANFWVFLPAVREPVASTA